MRSKGRTVFIGDVHGCAAELQQLIEKLELRSLDRVIMLGDLINRGPDPAGVVRYVHDNGFECIMGNHEEEYLRHSGMDPFLQLRGTLGETLHDWLARRPLWIEEDDFLAVHAGLQPHRHPSKTERRILLNIRTWDGIGRDLKDPENPPWYEFYSGSQTVFYGHWARRGLNIRHNTIGLDSGCVYGRSLSAYILETRKLVQIPANKVHYVPPALRNQAERSTG